MKLKTVRDPIHGDIKIFPLEWLIIDTVLFQRLRFISQLVGAVFVFPGCTHTRFSHSLGSMNIASIYGNKLLQDKSITYQEYRLIRLASLLHDISHGPFSHQFDETIYKKYGYKNGHDDFRQKVIKEFLPFFIEQKIKSISRSSILQSIQEDFKILEIKNLDEIIYFLEKVNKIYNDKGSYLFAIVQGTLGSDRLDFIWRDSYFSGVKGFSKGDIERIVFNCKIINNKLAYHIKTIDEIYSALYGRFMLYKNVYFHKNARAVDIMIQEILNLYSEIIDFSQYLENPDKFILLTDDYMFNLINQINQNNQNKNQEHLKQIFYLIQRIRSRNLWKIIYQEYLYPDQEVNLELLKQKFGTDIHIDITEELDIYHQKGDIFLYDEKDVIKFEEYIKENPIYNIKQPKIRILRVYTKKNNS